MHAQIPQNQAKRNIQKTIANLAIENATKKQNKRSPNTREKASWVLKPNSLRTNA